MASATMSADAFRCVILVMTSGGLEPIGRPVLPIFECSRTGVGGSVLAILVQVKDLYRMRPEFEARSR